MQALAVLRGCFAAYLAGVIIVWTGFLFAGSPSVFGPWISLVISATYGAAFAAIVTIVVLLIWLLPAWRRSLVLWWIAPISSSLLVGLLFASSLGGKEIFMSAAALGLFLGSVFWLAAFGRNKTALMRLNFEAT